jgi:hypothetical protein
MLMSYQAVSFRPKPCASRRIVASCMGMLTLAFVFYGATANLPAPSAQAVFRANKADRLPSVSALGMRFIAFPATGYWIRKRL